MIHNFFSHLVYYLVLQSKSLYSVRIRENTDQKKLCLGTVHAVTEQKMKFSIKDFYSKCDQICSFPQIWSHLPKKFLLENLVFYAVSVLFLN